MIAKSLSSRGVGSGELTEEATFPRCVYHVNSSLNHLLSRSSSLEGIRSVGIVEARFRAFGKGKMSRYWLDCHIGLMALDDRIDRQSSDGWRSSCLAASHVAATRVLNSWSRTASPLADEL